MDPTDIFLKSNLPALLLFLKVCRKTGQEMDNAPEGEQLKLNFTMAVQNFISKYIANVAKAETLFLRAKGNPGLVYFASFVQRVLENKDTMEMINSAKPPVRKTFIRETTSTRGLHLSGGWFKPERNQSDHFWSRPLPVVFIDTFYDIVDTDNPRSKFEENTEALLRFATNVTPFECKDIVKVMMLMLMLMMMMMMMMMIVSIKPLVPRVQEIKIPQLTFTGLICKGNRRFWHSLLWALGPNGLKSHG